VTSENTPVAAGAERDAAGDDAGRRLARDGGLARRPQGAGGGVEHVEVGAVRRPETLREPRAVARERDVAGYAPVGSEPVCVSVAASSRATPYGE
jgi:hypothetical protein